MIKYFLVPMSDPPYSKDNHQRPLYCEGLGISWSGSAQYKSKFYIIKASGSAAKLLALQNSVGVLDFPNTLTDKLDNLPLERKNKNDLILNKLGIIDPKSLDVKRFITLCANSDHFSGWTPDIFVPDTN